jgi:hypothetical protein
MSPQLKSLFFIVTSMVYARDLPPLALGTKEAGGAGIATSLGFFLDLNEDLFFDLNLALPAKNVSSPLCSLSSSDGVQLPPTHGTS